MRERKTAKERSSLGNYRACEKQSLWIPCICLFCFIELEVRSLYFSTGNMMKHEFLQQE